jgi:hypothetical protein
VVVSFIGGGIQSTRNQNTNMSQVTDKLFHIMLHKGVIEWTVYNICRRKQYQKMSAIMKHYQYL